MSIIIKPLDYHPLAGGIVRSLNPHLRSSNSSQTFVCNSTLATNGLDGWEVLDAGFSTYELRPLGGQMTLSPGLHMLRVTALRRLRTTVPECRKWKG